MQGMSFTTIRRRRFKSLEALSQGKENIDLLLMQASQVYSATSHWQSQIDAADCAKQEAVNLLATLQEDLQVSISIAFPHRHSGTILLLTTDKVFAALLAASQHSSYV